MSGIILISYFPDSRNVIGENSIVLPVLLCLESGT